MEAKADSARTRSRRQVFYQGPSTNKNKYDFPTLASIDTFRAGQLQKPPGTDFWGMDQDRQDAGLSNDGTRRYRSRRDVPCRHPVSWWRRGFSLCSALQKIVNLACGSFYALGAYFGITAVAVAVKFGLPPVLFFPVLILAGLAIGLVGLPIERVLRTVYRRDESYQLLLTFGLLLMFQDVFRFTWGATPRTMDNAYMVSAPRR